MSAQPGSTLILCPNIGCKGHLISLHFYLNKLNYFMRLISYTRKQITFLFAKKKKKNKERTLELETTHTHPNNKLSKIGLLPNLGDTE